jgi:hypothetical protein
MGLSYSRCQNTLLVLSLVFIHIFSEVRVILLGHHVLLFHYKHKQNHINCLLTKPAEVSGPKVLSL